MASRGINKVILVGNLGADPEVRYTPDGKAITSLSVATSDSWKDKNTGQMQERTEWHRVVIFGGLAPIAGEYLRKGSQVYLEGKLQTRKWQDQSGQDRYTTEIVVDQFSGQMQMLGGRTGGDTAFQGQQGGQQNFTPAMQQQQSYNQAPPAQQSQAQPQGGQAQQQFSSPAAAPFDDMDDDIPF